MKIYLAGPMRGIKDWNFPAFHEATARIRAMGHTVFSPAAVDEVLNYGPKSHSGHGDAHLRHVIAMDIACVFAADAIALLPGWEHSTGVTVELALAQFLRLEVLDAMTMEPCRASVPNLPWGVMKDYAAELQIERSKRGL